MSQLELIYELVSFRDYSAGEFIFTGSTWRRGFFVTRGRVKISVTATDGREDYACDVGQVFGEVVLFDAVPIRRQRRRGGGAGRRAENQDLFDLLRQHTNWLSICLDCWPVA